MQLTLTDIEFMSEKKAQENTEQKQTQKKPASAPASKEEKVLGDASGDDLPF